MTSLTKLVLEEAEPETASFVDERLRSDEGPRLLVEWASPWNEFRTALAPARDEPLLVEAAEDRHVGRVRAGVLGAPVERLHHVPDRDLVLAPPDVLHDFGLELVARVADEAERWLRPGGWLLVEVSPDRTQEVRQLMRAAGMREIASTKGGVLPMTRVVVGRR